MLTRLTPKQRTLAILKDFLILSQVLETIPLLVMICTDLKMASAVDSV